LRRREERREHEPARIGLEADVVDRDVEGLPGAREESGDPARDFGGALAAVRERDDVDRADDGRLEKPRVAAAGDGA
jgi:hypothetical protein